MPKVAAAYRESYNQVSSFTRKWYWLTLSLGGRLRQKPSVSENTPQNSEVDECDFLVASKNGRVQCLGNGSMEWFPSQPKGNNLWSQQSNTQYTVKEFLIHVANFLLFSIPPRCFLVPLDDESSSHRVVTTSLKRECWFCRLSEGRHSTTQKYCLECKQYIHDRCHREFHDLAAVGGWNKVLYQFISKR